MVTIGEKYVERVEKALCETVCLAHVRQMPMTVDDCWNKVRDLGFSGNVDRDFVESCYKRLDRDGHVKKEGDRYTITDDGREDVQKLEGVMRRVLGEFGGPSGTMGVGATGGIGATGGTTGGLGGRPR